MLLAICLINVSCIKKINLYQGDKDDEKEDNSGNNNSPQRKDIIVDTDFFYPFGDESQNCGNYNQHPQHFARRKYHKNGYSRTKIQ